MRRRSRHDDADGSARPFGKYRLVEPIASGGMAEVWRAEAPGAAGFVKEVALKLIRADHDPDGELVEMFIREARLASRLAHGNIVQVFDFDHVDGRYYIAMELVRGRTLRAVVDRCRALGVRFGLARAVHVCAEVSRALAYAHRADQGGLVHRDVSPQNVLLSFEGEVKLADFGIARVRGATEVTIPGTVKGKLAYMAPEQARGGAVDGRADVFSLGVVLWELCAGRRLFARDCDAATFAAVVAADPIRPPSAWDDEVPRELDDIVLGALARDPEERIPSADALAAALAALRLRLGADPAELDLRTLLLRLWPEGMRAMHEPPAERTAIRLGGRARECIALAPEVDASDAPAALARTGVARARGVRRAAIVLACAGVAGGGALSAGVHARRSGSVEPSPAVATTAPARAAIFLAAEPAARSGDPIPVTAPHVAAPELRAVPDATETDVEPTLPPGRRPQRAATATLTASQRPPTASRRVTEVTPAAPATAAVPSATAHLQELERGVLSVRAIPWAYVAIDGQEAGETPLEAPVSAATHRLRAHHPTLGDDELVVTLAPGERFVWRPRLSRP